MTAEGDGLAFAIAAIRISAIAPLQINQRKMARLDLDASQPGWFNPFDHRLRPVEFGPPGLGGATFVDPLQ